MKILHSLAFAIISILMVEFSTNLSSVQVLFLRALIGSIVLFTILQKTNTPIDLQLSKRSIAFYLIRAIITLVSLILWIKAMQNLGINEAMVLGYITPIWLLIIAILSCKEKLNIRSTIIILLNTIGVVIAFQPKFHSITFSGLVAAICTTILWAAYDVICKKQTETEHTILQAFYVHVLVSILSIPFAIYFWEPIAIRELIGVSLIGIIGSISVIALFVGYKFAPITVLIPFSYSRILFAVSFSYFLYDILPTYECMFGAAIIISSELYYYTTDEKVAVMES